MPETRSMASQSINGAGTPALASAIGTMEDETKVLVQPKRPIHTDAREQWVADKTALQENGSSIAAGTSLPGGDPGLQSLLHNSPFLYLGSPMTPYEWFKVAVMVIATSRNMWQNCISKHAGEHVRNCIVPIQTRYTRIQVPVKAYLPRGPQRCQQDCMPPNARIPDLLLHD